MSVDNTIHVAYGFHVNLYHSYRGDSCDGLGFGSDIRIIRKIISVLNELNSQGIPVKGTWDIENFFSLEKILPEYAPDIISGIRDRVVNAGDENIIMGYSNGALGAMNEAELEESVSLAVTNPEGSGLKDLFGTCEMIVRPQEVMFSPSQVRVYNKCGVKALCLYYSCIPFDAFRTIIPRLPDNEAYNPLTYRYKDDSITVIPTYSNADVCDAGCLRSWVKKLRRKQLSGEIDTDLFLFINMDADAIFWETLDIPLIGGKIANTDGIRGLVREIADLDYVVFDTPGGYLRSHDPIGEIAFTHDTADGNFTGFSSWAEKPYNRKIWTAVERSRAFSAAHGGNEKNSPSFSDRLLLLSTTHFGLATPVLNISREQKADELASRLIPAELTAFRKSSGLTIVNINGSDFQSLQLDVRDIPSDRSIRITSPDLTDHCVVRAENGTAFALMKFRSVKDRYEVRTEIVPADSSGNDELKLTTSCFEIDFSADAGIARVKYKGKTVGGKDFLKSYIEYNNRKYDFTLLSVLSVPVSGSGKCVRLSGCIHLPGEIFGGHFRYDFFTVPFSDAVFVKSEVSYPYTPERDSLSTENSSLGRFTDNDWTECVPFQLTPTLGGDLSVIKRNYEGDVSLFRVRSFPESDERNRTLDSFNHQLTAGFTGLSGNGAGILFSVSRQVLNSMACCPMRLYANGSVSMNPFGTYFGKQRHHFSASKNEIQNAYTLIAAQGKSLAPAYNGVSETSLNALLGFDGSFPDEDVLKAVCAFSDGSAAIAGEACAVTPFYGDNVKTAKAAVNDENGVKLRSPVLYGLSGNVGKYAVYGVKALTHIITKQIKARYFEKEV